MTNLLFSLLLSYIGVISLLTGRGGYRSGYTQGISIRVAGVFCLIAGAGFFWAWIKQIRSPEPLLTRADKQKWWRNR
jgi:hypothetical protein